LGLKRESSDRTSSSTGDTITRNTVFAMATQLSTAFFTAVLTIYLVRALGPSGFGTFALALGITGLLTRPSDLGTTQSAARFVAERHDDTEGVAGVLGMALRTRLATAVAIAVVVFALAGPISNAYGSPELAWPLRGAAIALFGQSVFRFFATIFIALRLTSRGLTLVLSESAMEFTASVALVLIGGGATGAAFGRAVGYVFGALLGLVLLGRLLGRSPLFGTGPSPVSRQAFVSYAGAMLIVQGAWSAFSQIDVLLIGAFLSGHAVGIFSAPLRLIAFLGYPGLALAQGVAPRLARHPQQRPQVAALQRAIRYIVMAQAALLPFVTVWAAPITVLALGSTFSESASVLRALSPYIFLTGLGPVLVMPLNYMGEARRRVPISIATLLVNAAIDIVLIPRIGILGAAVGSDVAYALYVAANLWLCHSLLDLPLGPLTRTAARSALAAGAMAIVLALFGTESLSVFEWLGGAATGTAVFIAVLLLSRELSLSEIQSAFRLPMRALRSG
jgi:O-antigen/teichoic acid export membrane protein